MKQRTGTRGRVAQRAIAIFAALAMSLGLVAVTATTAQAATPGIDISVLHNGQVVGDGTETPEGDQLTLRVQYDAAEDIAGKAITISLPEGITIPGALPSNEAIVSVKQNPDGTLTITFKDPIPADITEGAFAIVLDTEAVGGVTETPITWNIGDDQGGVNVIIEEEVIPPVVVKDGYKKSVSPGSLNDFVKVSKDPDTGHYFFDGFKDGIKDAVLTYTLELSSEEARTGYSIVDTLVNNPGFGYVAGSFAGELTAGGATTAFPFAPTVTGNTFSGLVDVPAQSVLKITYQVKVTDLDALEAAVKASFDALQGKPGNFGAQLKNDVLFGGGNKKSAGVGINGNVPGVGVGNNFAKSGNWTLQDVIADEDGKLTPAADMTYTLKADLTPWDGHNPNFTLNQNVVITDTLIEQASWKTGAGFIAISDEDQTNPFTSLTEVTDFTGDAAAFAHNDYVGKYAVVGNTLYVNVGKKKTTNVSITVQAQLNTIDGLPESNNTTEGGTRYPWNNRAQFYYGAANPADRDHNANVDVVPDNYEGGINDSAAFNKSALTNEVSVKPGESAPVDYRFEIDTSKPNIDPLNSKIIDEVNTEVFDITDLIR